MKRRQVLAGVGAASVWLSGCASNAGSNPGTSPSTIERPPNWLEGYEDCPKKEQQAVLRLSHRIESVERSAVVQFSELSDTSKTIVTFSASRTGGAVTCSNPSPFVELLDKVSSAGEEYRDEHDERPRDTYIGFADGFRRVDYLRVYDGVFRSGTSS